MEGDNWEDLFAVVRSSMSTSKSPTTTTASRDPFSSSPQPFNYQPRPNPFHCYSYSSASSDTCRSGRTAMQELEELCKPFLRPQQQQYHHHLSHLKRPLSSASSSSSSSSSTQPFFSRHPEPRLPSQQPPPRTRRRRSQQKRVVREVPADGLSSDVWAWRKYGQKPIKGSPFPRGYYRCSSSKMCIARKQVERSRKDPTMFVITYTGEHSHPVPTHRNSLAGSTRKKSSSSISVSRFTKTAKTTGEASKVPASSSSDVTVEEKKGREGESQQVEQLQAVLLEMEGEEGEEEEEEEEDDEGMVLMRELEMEMFGEEEILFVGYDEMEASDVGLDI